jgi:hypothetical protein
MRQTAIVLAMLSSALALGLAPRTAAAGEDEQGRPFARGTIIPRLGFGFGYSPDLITLGWGLGAGYFVVDGLEVGATVSGTHLIWGRDLKREFPGIEDQLPNALIEITPGLRYVFYRSRWFSPYIFAGVGPTFVTHNAPAPVMAHWSAGPGFFIGLGRRVFLDISVQFSGRFPGPQCTEAFTDTFTTADGPVELQAAGLCGVRWRPGIGVGLRF